MEYFFQTSYSHYIQIKFRNCKRFFLISQYNMEEVDQDVPYSFIKVIIIKNCYPYGLILPNADSVRCVKLGRNWKPSLFIFQPILWDQSLLGLNSKSLVLHINTPWHCCKSCGWFEVVHLLTKKEKYLLGGKAGYTMALESHQGSYQSSTVSWVLSRDILHRNYINQVPR